MADSRVMPVQMQNSGSFRSPEMGRNLPEKVRKPSQIVRDGEFISHVLTGVEGVARMQNHRASPLAGIGARAVTAAIGAVDVIEAAKYDVVRSDRFHRETIKTTCGVMGTILLAGAATVACAGASVAVGPAVLLGIGAGLAGKAIGEKIGEGITAFRIRLNH